MAIKEEIYSLLEKEERTKEYLYVTDIGSCPKKVMMGFGKYEKKPLSPQEKLMFDIADFLHYKVMLLLKDSNRFVVIKNEYKLNDGLPTLWHGRCDDILFDLNDKKFLILEIKSTRGFVKNMELPKNNHEIQTKIYINALRKMHWNIDCGILIYFDRSGSNEPQEYPINYIPDIDDDLINNKFNIYEQYYTEYKQYKVLPEILSRVIKRTKNEFKLVPNWQCDLCKFRGLSCYPDLRINKIAEIKNSKLIIRKDYEQYENDIRNMCKLEINN